MSLDTNLKNLTTAVATKVKEVRTWLNGNDGTGVSRLSTTATTVVDAINEVNAAVAGATGINDATTSTSTTWSSSKISTEDASIRSDLGADIAAKPDINDAAASGTSVYSSNKTDSQIAAAVAAVPAPSSIIDDTTPSASSVYSSTKTDTQISAAVAGLVDAAPGTLDTLNELAAALGDDANFATTINTSLGNRVRVDTAAQGLDATQQGNARTNIAAAAAADLTALSTAVGPTDTDYVALFEAGLV